MVIIILKGHDGGFASWLSYIIGLNWNWWLPGGWWMPGVWFHFGKWSTVMLSIDNLKLMGLDVQYCECGSFLWRLWYHTWCWKCLYISYDRNMAWTCLLTIADLRQTYNLKFKITSNMHYSIWRTRCGVHFEVLAFQNIYQWKNHGNSNHFKKILLLSICQPSEIVIHET